MNVYEIIKRPVVTEKSTIAREVENVVTLAVDPRANKQQIKSAVEALFAEQTPRSCPTDPVEKQAHLRALALARLVTGRADERFLAPAVRLPTS